MELRQDLLDRPLSERLTYDREQNLFFVNLAGFSLRSQAQIDEIERLIQEKTAPAGGRVYAVVNYENFSILPELLDPYVDMISRLMERNYSGATRYSTSGFLRMKLGDALARRAVAPHIYESAEEARAHLADFGQTG